MCLRIGAIAGAFVLAAVIMAPLRWAWAMAGAQEDLSIAVVDGSIWNGRIEGVSWRRNLLGNFDVALSPLARAFPTLQLSNGTGPLKYGRISISSNVMSLDAGEIQTSVPLHSVGDSTELALRISGAAVTLTDKTCNAASGQIQIAASAELGSPAFDGELACVQGRLTAHLSSSHGEAVLEVSGPDFSGLAYRSASPTLAMLFTTAGIPQAGGASP